MFTKQVNVSIIYIGKYLAMNIIGVCLLYKLLNFDGIICQLINERGILNYEIERNEVDRKRKAFAGGNHRQT